MADRDLSVFNSTGSSRYLGLKARLVLGGTNVVGVVKSLVGLVFLTDEACLVVVAYTGDFGGAVNDDELCTV